MTDLFSDIAKAHKGLTGWCSWNKAQTLAAAVIALRPTTTVEIGVWGGKSCIPLAMAHKAIGKGQVTAIDPWFAADSIAGQIHPADKEWWADQAKHQYAYDQFNAKVYELELQSWIDVRRHKSDEIEPPKEIGLLHLDGNHGEQTIRDVERYAPNVVIGGIAILDDLGWTGGSVNRAVDYLLLNGFKELYRVTDENSTWGVFQRIK